MKSSKICIICDKEYRAGIKGRSIGVRAISIRALHWKTCSRKCSKKYSLIMGRIRAKSLRILMKKHIEEYNSIIDELLMNKLAELKK